MNNEPERGSVVLAINRALLGEVSPSFRAIYFKVEEGTLHLHFIIDGVPSADDIDSIHDIGGETIASFNDLNIVEEWTTVNHPEKIQMPPGWEPVFHRKEP
ncbi:hypothetical protein ACFVUS_06040 [Nocardia sp. NPDC058058]|uniref:hypothetical protein n=1 Tax=Nocardia sp. NPDC058058 TaxID=3346317 RepID=UPI0036DE32BD